MRPAKGEAQKQGYLKLPLYENQKIKTKEKTSGKNGKNMDVNRKIPPKKIRVKTYLPNFYFYFLLFYFFLLKTTNYPNKHAESSVGDLLSSYLEGFPNL